MAKKIVEKPRNGGKMTESEYFSKIRSALRRAFMWWHPMMLALEAASRPYKGKNKLQKKEYQCFNCKQWFKRTDVHVDHKVECGSLKTYEDIVPFLQRLTVEDVNMFQVLCKDKCHKEKTNDERKRRKDSSN